MYRIHEMVEHNRITSWLVRNDDRAVTHQDRRFYTRKAAVEWCEACNSIDYEDNWS